MVHTWSDRPEGAILAFEKAQSFAPKMATNRLTTLGMAYYLKGRYEGAIKVLERAVGLKPDFLYGYTVLAAAYGQLGSQEGTSRAAGAVRRLDPYFSTDGYGRLFRDPADAAHVVDGLRKAGLN